MIKNADESIARGASGHTACILLTRNDTIDIEDCRLAYGSLSVFCNKPRRCGWRNSRIVYPENGRQRHRAHTRSVNIKNADECIQLYPAALKARHAYG